MATTPKSVRKRLGLSQYRLAQLSRVSRFKISLVECGYTELTAAESERIERALTLEKGKIQGVEK